MQDNNADPRVVRDSHSDYSADPRVMQFKSDEQIKDFAIFDHNRLK